MHLLTSQKGAAPFLQSLQILSLNLWILPFKFFHTKLFLDVKKRLHAPWQINILPPFTNPNGKWNCSQNFIYKIIGPVTRRVPLHYCTTQHNTTHLQSEIQLRNNWCICLQCKKPPEKLPLFYQRTRCNCMTGFHAVHSTNSFMHKSRARCF